MQIKTTRQINARTLDGRVYAAGEGTVSEFDDDDTGMVAMAKSLIASGQAEHYGDAGTVSPPPSTGNPIVPEDELEAMSPEHEIDQLRAEAEAAGVKVDKRWGVDRIREEIATAVAE